MADYSEASRKNGQPSAGLGFPAALVATSVLNAAGQIAPMFIKSPQERAAEQQRELIQQQRLREDVAQRLANDYETLRESLHAQMTLDEAQRTMETSAQEEARQAAREYRVILSRLGIEGADALAQRVASDVQQIHMDAAQWTIAKSYAPAVIGGGLGLIGITLGLYSLAGSAEDQELPAQQAQDGADGGEVE